MKIQRKVQKGNNLHVFVIYWRQKDTPKAAIQILPHCSHALSFFLEIHLFHTVISLFN